MIRRSMLLLAAVAMLSFCVPAAAETFTSSDGVLQIDLPNSNWKQMSDTSKWIAFSDGASVITIEHYSNGDVLPAITVADSHYVNTYEAIVTTQNEVFIITGKVVSPNAISDVCTSIMSAKVLRYDTKLATNKASGAGQLKDYSIVKMDATYYVSADLLNVRLGCSTDEQILGTLKAGDSVHVTGKVQKNGADYGWYQIAFGNGTGFIMSDFVSSEAPKSSSASSKGDADSLTFTGIGKNIYDKNGKAIWVREATNGTWYDENLTEYNQILDYEFSGPNGSYTLYPPVDSSKATPDGEPEEVFWANGNATTLTYYTDGRYYTPEWVSYTYQGDGTYLGADGSVLYAYEPDLSNIDATMVQCPYCGDWFEAGNVFRNHYCPNREAHPMTDEDTVQCPYCGNWYARGEEFDNHYCPNRDAHPMIDDQLVEIASRSGERTYVTTVTSDEGVSMDIYTYDGVNYYDALDNPFWMLDDGSWTDGSETYWG